MVFPLIFLYRVVICSKQLVLVDAKDHIPDSQSSLRKEQMAIIERKKNKERRPSTPLSLSGCKSSYLLCYALRLDVRDEDSTTHFGVPTFDDHDT